MEFSSIIFGSVLYLASAGNPSRMGSFLLQLIQVRFPNRWSVFISIEQGQSHGTGGGWPGGAGLALARRRSRHGGGTRPRGEARRGEAAGAGAAPGLGRGGTRGAEGAVAGPGAAPVWLLAARPRSVRPAAVP